MLWLLRSRLRLCFYFILVTFAVMLGAQAINAILVACQWLNSLLKP